MNGIPLKLLNLQAFAWRYVGVYDTRQIILLGIYIALVWMWIKVPFSTYILLKCLPSPLKITAGILLKISNVCHYQCWFYEKFNIPPVFKIIQTWWRRMFSSVFFRLQGVLLSSNVALVSRTLHESKQNTNIYLLIMLSCILNCHWNWESLGDVRIAILQSFLLK